MGVEELADLLPQGVIVCDARARVLFANRVAQALLEDGDGLALGNGGELRGRMPGETAALRRLVAAAAGALEVEAGGALRVSRESGETLPLLVCPLRAGGAVVFVGDQASPIRRAQLAIRRWYGLTAAEARLATALAEGATLEQAALALEITRNTARTHLKHIFEKTGTNRQSALVRLLLAGPAIVR